MEAFVALPQLLPVHLIAPFASPVTLSLRQSVHSHRQPYRLHASATLAAAACLAILELRQRRRVARGHKRSWIAVRSSDLPEYGATAEYWDKRYTEDGNSTFDWLGDYDRCKPFIEKATNVKLKESAVLDLGCGNARLCEKMHDDGYKNIVAVDISTVAIDMMRQRNAELRPEIQWCVGDAFKLDAEDESFDVVIDKSTLDAIACDQDHINVNMVKLIGEVSRVLRTGGAYLVFTSVGGVASGAVRLPHVLFEVEEIEVPVPFSQLKVVIARKRPGADTRATMNSQGALEYAIELDKHTAEFKKRQEEAEKRLQQQAGSSSTAFQVLD